MPAAIAASILPAVFKGITGLIQSSQANQLGNEYSRPNFEVPQGLLDSVDIVKNNALQSGYPRRDIAESRIDEVIANALGATREAATSPWEVSSMANRMLENKTEKIKDLDVTGERMRQDNAVRLATLLQDLGVAQEKRFMYNEYQPYMNAMNTMQELRGAGTQNLFSGISDVSGVITNAIPEWQAKRDQRQAAELNTASNNLENLFSGIESNLKYTAPKY